MGGVARKHVPGRVFGRTARRRSRPGDAKKSSMKMFAPKLVLVSVALLAGACQTDAALIARQQETIEKQEQMIAELKTTMDEQGEVIVEQIEMMSEMQITIDKQRTLMKETTETLRECAARL
jgi:hypothetical protein